MNKVYQNWLPRVIAVAKAAGEVITDIYHKKNYSISSKLDNSPVTEADIQAHHIIEAGLREIDPSIPILSEEGEHVPYKERSQWSRLWLVDPLDGTREFIHGTDEFTVNIALIEEHVPVLGVIVAPILQHSYWALKGEGAYYQHDGHSIEPLQACKVPSPLLRVIVSWRFNQKPGEQWMAFRERLGDHELIYLGSSLKICWIAQGKADLYPRMGQTGEWDTAAGQCILEEAGGQLIDMAGNPLKYNQHDTLVNPMFCAMGSSQLASLCCG